MKLEIDERQASVIFGALDKAITATQLAMTRKGASQYMRALVLEHAAYQVEQERIKQVFPSAANPGVPS